jgi:hypothetical protein
MQCNYSRQKEILKNAPPHDKRQMRVSKTGHTNQDRQESTGGNTGLAKVAAQCYADTFVVNQSFWFSASIPQVRDGKNRHLRQDRNRYGEVKNRIK